MTELRPDDQPYVGPVFDAVRAVTTHAPDFHENSQNLYAALRDHVMGQGLDGLPIGSARRILKHAGYRWRRAFDGYGYRRDQVIGLRLKSGGCK